MLLFYFWINRYCNLIFSYRGVAILFLITGMLSFFGIVGWLVGWFLVTCGSLLVIS